MNSMLLGAILDRNELLNVGDAAILAVIGIVIVFIVLALLMFIVWVEGKIFESSDNLQEKHPETYQKLQNFKQKLTFWKKDKNDAVEVQNQDAPLAQGTCGELKLINVEERDAAMIMAIVADETKTPLNELRFKSIKRVEEEK